MKAARFERGREVARTAEISENFLTLRNISPQGVLKQFIGDGPENEARIKQLLKKINGAPHVGFEVRDIDETVGKLQIQFPDRGYKLVKKFKSVGIPKNYDGSECIMAQVKSDDVTYPDLELFSIDWRGAYKNVSSDQRRKLIEHFSVSTAQPEDVSVVMDMMSKFDQIQSVIPPQINKDSGEIFGYLVNSRGEKLEVNSSYGKSA